jgi:SAM-dependent methyltransferase
MPEGRGQKPDDARRFAPATERNKEPILAMLERHLPGTGVVLEIASGTGQHVAHFATSLPALTWQPSDADEAARASIQAWSDNLANVRAPIALDVRNQPWPVSDIEAVLCINMIHIAPWEATEALLRGAKDVLRSGGLLLLYGPYRRFGRHTADSNEAFDASLRARNPAWGVRDLEAVVELAGKIGFSLTAIVDMPANNLGVVLRRES